RNVIGRIGTAQRYLLFGAHYDGQGPGMPSASDNAAGVAVIIEIMRELKAKELPVSLVAVAFDDEEQGLNGSRYYSDHPPYPLENTQAALIFDTLGRPFMDLATWTMFVLGAEYSKELAAVIQKRSRPEMLVAGTDLIGPRSDFAPFAVKHVPYLFFSHATHKDYHGPAHRHKCAVGVGHAALVVLHAQLFHRPLLRTRKSPRTCCGRLRRSLEMDIRCRRAPRPGREDSGIEVILPSEAVSLAVDGHNVSGVFGVVFDFLS